MNRLRIQAEALAEINKLELPEVKKVKAKDIKQMPDDVSDIPSEDLGNYYSMYESTCAWIDKCLTIRKIDISIAEEMIEYVFNKKMVKAKGKTAVTRKSNVFSDPLYLECKLELKSIETEIEILSSKYRAYQAYARSISREITIRHDSPFLGNKIPGGKPKGISSPSFGKSLYDRKKKSVSERMRKKKSEKNQN